MKVWVVIRQETEEPYELCGVYSSSEKAEAGWGVLVNHETMGDIYDVIEVELDKRLIKLVTPQEAWDKEKARTDEMLKRMSVGID